MGYDYERRVVHANDSAQISHKITQVMGEIEKLRGQAAKAESAGQLGRADGLRSKARNLTQSLDQLEVEYATALHREMPL